MAACPSIVWILVLALTARQGLAAETNVTTETELINRTTTVTVTAAVLPVTSTTTTTTTSTTTPTTTAATTTTTTTTTTGSAAATAAEVVNSSTGEDGGEASGAYIFGYDVIPRDHTDHLQDTIYILHPDDNFPPTGYITAWNIYAGATGSVTLATWRPNPLHANEFRLVGYANVTVNVTGELHHVIPEDERIPFLAGDRLGLYFLQANPVSFTKGSSCDRHMMYVHNPCEFSHCRDFAFREKEAGWNPCRIYSVSAEIVNASLPASETDLTVWWKNQQQENVEQISLDPTLIDVQLVNGRSISEGLLLVRTSGERWGTVCADGWDDADAQVTCRQLGYSDGVAVYPPFFGSGNASMRIHLEDVACNGTERHLAECRRSVRWGESRCDHSEDVGIQCNNDYRNDTEHVFGYPAIARQDSDKWKRGTYIPHPHQQLPWQRGVITSWHFFVTAKKNASLTFQVWRRKGNDNFLLVGQSHFRNLSPGRHDKYLTGNDQIFFRVGDVIGFQFERPASVPYDLSGKSCDHDEKAMYIYPMYERPVLGRTHVFQTKPAHWKPCRTYSVFAGVQTSDSAAATASSTFNVGDTQYRVLLDRSATKAEAQAICSAEMGPNGELLDLADQSEYSFISGALNDMPLAKEDGFWLKGTIHSARGFTRWAPCHPVDGQECVMLKKSREGDSPSSDYFYMHSAHCHERHMLVCKLTDPLMAALGGHRHKTTSNDVTPVKVTRVERRTDGPRTGIIVGVVVGILLSVIIISITAVCLHRQWRQRDNVQDAESTVRFVSLEEKAPL